VAKGAGLLQDEWKFGLDEINIPVTFKAESALEYLNN